VAQALKEVEAYKLFAPHENIIPAIDHSVASDKSDASQKTVYILLPYYRRGNLQDLINANLVNHTKFPEKKLLKLILGVSKALKTMHQYKVKQGSGADANERAAKNVRSQAARADQEATEAHDDDEVEQPLMASEVTRNQEGIATGGLRAYSHRDIKPGKTFLTQFE
jgi:serine/threonine kinase 16